ncbi:unnamed protein product [Effrenium voratum]|nr:unnamed protein product [Effrenium voratum]
MTLFFLQQEGLLPPLRSLPAGPESFREDPRDVRQLLVAFAVFAQDVFSRPGLTADIWQGCWVQVEPSEAGRADERVMKALRQLREDALTLPLEQIGFPAGTSRRGSPGLASPDRAFSTPPRVVRARALAPGSSVSEARACSESAEKRTARWQVDADWVARKWSSGRLLQEVPLSSDTGLTREGWAQRFERREYQIRIGKATREYQLWSEHSLRTGRQGPATPKAAEQTTKSSFEAQYAEWRRQLHEKPRA